ncbi:MAG: 2,3-diphosphoglycerate-dependent phosphoglycerate mutase [Elusimicrobiaceae bacterium]|nr:2,3-diphosphoglycerate-dependent phosphoglycerate mutase [Elusimicrobiaceae bacterium]
MKKIILLRHGQSTWNLENRFTGWTDVPLTPQGQQEATKAGLLLKEQNILLDGAFTSYLTRAIDTLYLTLQALEQPWIPVEKSWRLNEKHYGALQGLNKKQTAQKYGEKQVQLWRRSYDIPAPPLTADDPRSPYADPRYLSVSRSELPLTESLKTCTKRLLPYWQWVVWPRLHTADNLLISAHGNSLRSIVKYLKNLSDEEIVSLNLPTGIPYIFELTDHGKVLKDYFLGNPDEIAQKIQEVAAQSNTCK